MDRPRTDIRNPTVTKALRLLKTGGLLIGIVFAVASLPVVFLYFWMDSPEPSAVDAGAMAVEQIEVHYPSDETVLGGTISLPIGVKGVPGFVVVHGSGKATRGQHRSTSQFFSTRGYAVLTYDKRGVGESGGEYSTVGTSNSRQMISTLAQDALAGVRLLRERPEVDPNRIGLLGFSQAGWIIPLAASRSDDVAFIVLVSGPTVSVGEEIYYSYLTGDDTGTGPMFPPEELARKLHEYSGKRGFDPLQALRQLEVPGLWLFGGRDASIPVPESVRILEDLASSGKPFTYRLHPEAGHGMRDSATGSPIAIFPEILEWLDSTALR